MQTPKDCVRYSGGATGTEEFFGITAEQYGLEEVNYSFAGHQLARERGIKTLSPEELAKLIVAAQEDVKHQQILATAKEPDHVQVLAKDPGAAAFVKAHMKPISAVTRRLAAEGQL